MTNIHLGLILECEYRRGLNQDDAFDETFTLSRMAEEGGLDSVWLAERHFAAPGRALDEAGGRVASFASAPLIMASAIAARTESLRVGIAVSVLPLAHPIRLAEEVATLDQISNGRLDFGVGRSGFLEAYSGYGVDYAESRGRFSECLEVLQLAWTQESFSYSGHYYSYEDVCVVPKPQQRPYPPLRQAANSDDTFAHVGARGFPIFIGLRGNDISKAAENLAVYRKAWHDAGHAGDGDVILRIPVFVAETAEDAYEVPRESTMHSYVRLAERYAKSVEEMGAAGPDRRGWAERLANPGYEGLLENRLAYGTPDAVARRLSDWRDHLGLSGFVIEPNVGGSTPRDKVLRSVQLFASEVAPALR